MKLAKFALQGVYAFGKIPDCIIASIRCMGRASGIRIMGGLSKLLHGVEHRTDGVGIGHLLGHLFLPLSQKLRSALLIIVGLCHLSS